MSSVGGTPQHLAWGAQALWQQLVVWLPRLSVEVLARAESTNTVLVDRARRAAGQADAPVTGAGELDRLALHSAAPNGPPARGRRADDTRPCLLVAEHQTRGRGRMGRSWHAAPGASLTFSIMLPLRPQAAQGFAGLSLAVGVALADALDPVGDSASQPGDTRIALKWPNDLWLRDGSAAHGGRKLGGVLIETVPVGEERMVVVGVGLNVQPLVSEPLATGYACLQELNDSIDAPGALACVAAPLVQALLRFQADGLAPFEAAYRRRDLLLGRLVQAGELRGQCEGIAPDGGLRVRRADGSSSVVHGGEVSVRPATAG